jgi:hypothetical protein
MKPTTIYGLYDPETDAIRYVGKTNQKLPKRLVAHCQEKRKCHRTNWIQQLVRRGLRPIIEPIETIFGEWPWQESEKWWIAEFKRLGANLTNNTSGGDGVPNLPAETRARMRLVWLGRKHSIESMEKMRRASTGRFCSQETRQKMSAKQRGRKITWVDKVAEGLRKLAPDDVFAIKEAFRNGEPNWKLAKRFGVHRTTISKIKMGTYYDRYRKTVQPG